MTIDGYLTELLGALRLGRRRRRRIAAEVSDHLTELVEEEEARGATPGQAVTRAARRFGDPSELAAEFNRDLARHSLNRATWALLACVTMAFAAAGLSLNGAAPARPWPSDLAFYTLGPMLIQVAIVCCLNGLLLAVVAPWALGRPLGGRAAALAGRSLAVAAIALLPTALSAAGTVAGPVTLPERMLLAMVAVATPLTAFWALRAATRATWLRAEPGAAQSAAAAESTPEVMAEVCGALAGRWVPAGWAYGLALALWQAAYRRAPRLMRWVDLVRHPWRAATTFSVAVGLGLKAPDFAVGDPDIAVSAIEALAVFVSFAVLGGLLGLRAPRRRATSSKPDLAELRTA